MILLKTDERSPALINELLELWESSVRATHTFLPEEMIRTLKPLVRDELSRVETLILAEDERGFARGFMGIEDGKIGMLFAAPEYRGRGIGRMLINCAIDEYGCRFVDVNEQNGGALGFYERMGFRVSGRSDLDGQGNPFPVLHLELGPEHREKAAAGYHIGPAEEKDIPALLEMARDIIDHSYRDFLGDAAVDEYISSGQCDNEIRDNAGSCIVIKQDGVCAGLSILLENCVHLIMVGRQFQRHGIGTILLGHIERRLFRIYPSIWLQSFAGNTPAIRFYERNGWRKAETIPAGGADYLYRFVKEKSDAL